MSDLHTHDLGRLSRPFHRRKFGFCVARVVLGVANELYLSTPVQHNIAWLYASYAPIPFRDTTVMELVMEGSPMVLAIVFVSAKAAFYGRKHPSLDTFRIGKYDSLEH